MEQVAMLSEDNAAEEEQVMYSFTAFEIDVDYEFDAVRFFDFLRNESPLEVRQAEDWFESAGGYPPSPFVLRFATGNEVFMDNVNIGPKSKCYEVMCLANDDSSISEAASTMEVCEKAEEGKSVAQQASSVHGFQNPSENSCSGSILCSPMVNHTNENNQQKSSLKPSFSRTSTLMKPTLSQLAKQNHYARLNHSRMLSSNAKSRASLLKKADESTTATCGVENQSAKRQKLEGGLLRKVQDVTHMQQINFVHKEPKREGLLSALGSTPHRKPRITIPREPDLATAQRARIRQRNNADVNSLASVASGFKALPLNHKILEAPSWFPKKSTLHLSGSQGSSQQGSTSLKTPAQWIKSVETLCRNGSALTFESGHKESSCNISSTRPQSCKTSHGLKAIPLNKKELHFLSGDKSPVNPPIELFNQLSLASDAQQTSSKLQKGHKENRWGCSQQESEVLHGVRHWSRAGA